MAPFTSAVNAKVKGSAPSGDFGQTRVTSHLPSKRPAFDGCADTVPDQSTETSPNAKNSLRRIFAARSRSGIPQVSSGTTWMIAAGLVPGKPAERQGSGSQYE